MLHSPVTASTGSLHLVAHTWSLQRGLALWFKFMSSTWFRGEMWFVALRMCLTPPVFKMSAYKYSAGVLQCSAQRISCSLLVILGCGRMLCPCKGWEFACSLVLQLSLPSTLVCTMARLLWNHSPMHRDLLCVHLGVVGFVRLQRFPLGLMNDTHWPYLTFTQHYRQVTGDIALWLARYGESWQRCRKAFVHGKNR